MDLRADFACSYTTNDKPSSRTDVTCVRNYHNKQKSDLKGEAIRHSRRDICSACGPVNSIIRVLSLVYAVNG